MTLAGFSPAIQTLLEKIIAASPPDQPIYLVGGAVRDLLSERLTDDLDLILPEKAIPYGRRLANTLGGAFYPLDIARDTGRIILHTENWGRFTIDCASLRGNDLESDLRNRDFTINAMALDLRQPSRLIDPLRGAEDLRNKILRTCSPDSLVVDPLRILRAVRLSIEFKLKFSAETIQQARQALPGLAQTSAERLRDEIFQLFNGPNPAGALRTLDNLQALEFVFPEISELKGVIQSPPHSEDVWEHTLRTIQKLGAVFNSLALSHDPESAANWTLGLVSLRLGRFRLPLHEHLNQQLNPDRSVRALLLLAALYHDIGKPHRRQIEPDGRFRFVGHEQLGEEIIRARANGLRLSNLEVNRLACVVRHHMRPILLASSAASPSRRAVYRFFRDTSSAGVDICLLSLADILATYRTTVPQEIWIRQIDVVRTLLEAWWETPHEQVSPPSLLNGEDLQKLFDLRPGPLIGQLLEAVREAQASGELHNRQDALEFVRNRLSQG